MAFAVIISMTIIAGILAKKNDIVLERKMIAMVLLIEALGVALGGYDHYMSGAGFSGVVKRADIGGTDRKEELIVEAMGEAQDWEVSISSRQLSEKEANELLDRAQQEIDETILGKNSSANSVTRVLNPVESYVNGLVLASWEFSNPMLISTEGVLQYENLENEAPAGIYATAKLVCSDQERVYTFPLCLGMPKVSSPEGFTYYLNKAIQTANDADPTGTEVALPTQVEHMSLNWSKQPDNRGVMISLLGLVAGVGICLGRLEEERRRKVTRHKALSSDYPDIVSALSLYVSAGITVRSSFARIFNGYRDRKVRAGIRDRPGYEVIGKVVRKMEDGEGEEAAYRSLARMTGHKDYAKLSMMLTKQLKHGSTRLAAQLEKEEAQAFEARKLAARTLGEEASTKLLAPMLMLLSVVIVILVAPAMFTIGM